MPLPSALLCCHELVAAQMPSSLQIDSMQALLHCPSVLVCAGREPFKPIMMENLRKHSVEKLPGLTPRSVGGHVNENNDSKKNGEPCCTGQSMVGRMMVPPPTSLDIHNPREDMCIRIMPPNMYI